MAETVLPPLGGGGKYQVIVQVDAYSTVTAAKDGVTRTGKARGGVYYIKGMTVGTWTVTAVKGSSTASREVTVEDESMTRIITLNYNQIPVFTYTGDYEIVDDGDNAITESQDNWKIRFLTSGTLTFSDLRGAENGIDVFAVGGGGGGGDGDTSPGGGGGYTETQLGLAVIANTGYNITIGAGGQTGTGKGGDTTAFGITAEGGLSAHSNAENDGADGGSGGGELANDGGSDGGNGGGTRGGTGQGTTTREFGESAGKLYAGGGGGGASNNKSPGKGGDGGGGDGGATHGRSQPGAENTGGGGGGRGYAGTNEWGIGEGGSGIVVIRNAREVA